ncbi:hypothetical protein Pmani_011902 [Petrolisthes manimaculis]|uniref:Uncharacterized protein n=1 Tax=Petrolisthes manimaculis TaxID=1843537 RepID=A0AAE1UDW2_9EUCA|nr:hypothetical protein Pmani_011902 [Petrolisthes manimaculis]
MWNKFASSQLAIVVVFCLALGVVGQEIDSLIEGDFCMGKDNAVVDIDGADNCCRCVSGIVDCVPLPECPAPPTDTDNCCKMTICGCDVYDCSTTTGRFGRRHRCRGKGK